MKRLLKASPFKISMLITFATLSAYWVGVPFFETMELKSLDLRFVSRGKIEPGTEVAIVTIDEKSLDKFGRWPWPRKRIGELIDALGEYGVNSIGFDIVFAEPDHNSDSTIIDDIGGQVSRLGLQNDELAAFMEKARLERDNDAILEDAFRRSGKSILGYFFHTSGEELKHLEGQTDDGQEYFKRSAYSSVQYLSAQAQAAQFMRNVFSVESNLPRFSEAADGFGYFNVFPDRDGTVRWAQMLIKHKDIYFPPLSLQLARKYLGNPPLTLNVAEYGVDTIRLGDTRIPTNEGGGLLINYRGGNKTFPHYSVYDVITKAIPKEKLENRIILVGATAIGIYDMRVTPFSGVFPGVEIHANIIDNILKKDFLFRPDWVSLVDLSIILGIGLILGLILPRLGPLPGAIAVVFLFAAFSGGNYYLFSSQGIWLNFVYPAFSLLTIYTAITLYHYMTEEKERKKVRNAFQYYMTSSVVQEVLKDPAKLKLGGEKKNLSVLFSDIRSFTSISERMSPEDLVKFLNEYLTVMTDIVFKHDGVLDKYMGDAIMAIYGAPAERTDHPYRACITALEMMESLRELHKSWEKKGLPKMDIGIGISTGQMVVGNMGSERRFDYTVMGDTVNLGSRLEGINKMYGTNIIISEDTYAAVQDVMACRELDAVKVKGKNRPVKIYELMARKGADERFVKLTSLFEDALGHYRGMQWSEAVDTFNKVLELKPTDYAAKMYIERCNALAKEPPPPGWDGVFEMKTK